METEGSERNTSYSKPENNESYSSQCAWTTHYSYVLSEADQKLTMDFKSNRVLLVGFPLFYLSNECPYLFNSGQFIRLTNACQC